MFDDVIHCCAGRHAVAPVGVAQSLKLGVATMQYMQEECIHAATMAYSTYKQYPYMGTAALSFLHVPMLSDHTSHIPACLTPLCAQ